MILFLNFAPISFMGGAEKWMNESAKKVSKYEKSLLISVDKSLSNIYSNLVLKRTFDERINKELLHKNLTIDLYSLIPFSSRWKQIRSLFKNARIIYTKHEVVEIVLILYFGGITSLKKTVSGIHSPFIYKTPQTFFDKLHNFIYTSFINRIFLKTVQKVHVLNNKDKDYLEHTFKLKNVNYVPNGVPIQLRNHMAF